MAILKLLCKANEPLVHDGHWIGPIVLAFWIVRSQDQGADKDVVVRVEGPIGRPWGSIPEHPTSQPIFPSFWNTSSIRKQFRDCIPDPLI
jgi:hypothetical protein